MKDKGYLWPKFHENAEMKDQFEELSEAVVEDVETTHLRRYFILTPFAPIS